MAKTKKLTAEEYEAWKAASKEELKNREFVYNPDYTNPYSEDTPGHMRSGWDDTIQQMALGWLSNPKVAGEDPRKGGFGSALQALLQYGYGENFYNYTERELGKYDEFDRSQLANFMNPSTLLSGFKQHMNDDQFNRFVTQYYDVLKKSYRFPYFHSYRKGGDWEYEFPRPKLNKRLLDRGEAWFEGHLGIY